MRCNLPACRLPDDTRNGKTVNARRFVGFVLAGGTATVFNYAVFALVLLAGAHHLAAAAIGYLAGIGVSYSINRRWVFRGALPVPGRATRYVAAYLAALVLQLALLEALVRGGIIPLAANAIALTVVVAANYLAISHFVFPERNDRR